MAKRSPVIERFGGVRAATEIPAGRHVFLYAFDLLELNGKDFRRGPFEVRNASQPLAFVSPGLRLNQHLSHDGDVVFRLACQDVTGRPLGESRRGSHLAAVDGPHVRSTRSAKNAPARAICRGGAFLKKNRPARQFPSQLEFGLRACTCQQRQADFSTALKESLPAISLCVDIRFQARLARLPVLVDGEQFACLVRG
jgi:hypothetical protein